MDISTYQWFEFVAWASYPNGVTLIFGGMTLQEKVRQLVNQIDLAHRQDLPISRPLVELLGLIGDYGERVYRLGLISPSTVGAWFIEAQSESEQNDTSVQAAAG